MIPIKSEKDLRIMRQACVIAANVLDSLCEMAQVGVSTWDLDQAAKELMAEYSARSACYKYKAGSLRFPCYTCISINDEVIHGISTPQRVLKDGDIVKMDVSLFYNGFVGDNTRTVLIGNVSPQVLRLVETSKEALRCGIAAAKSGNRVGDISHAIQTCLEFGGYGIVKEFTGHGVGRKLHEEPQIPNYGKAGTGPVLCAGMTLAIEPMVTLGSAKIIFADDGWTVRTADSLPSCHVEHTVLVTEGEAEILTIPKKDFHSTKKSS